MSLETDITAIRKLMEDKPLFKPAGPSELANRGIYSTNDFLPAVGTIVILDSADQIRMMHDFETVGFDDDRLLKLFSHLVHTGLAWKLQGMYGRQAKHMITDGWLNNNGTILKLPRPRVGEAVNEDKPLFKPAGAAEISNRPHIVRPFKKITSVDQLRELAKFGVEVFVSSGAPLWEQHSFKYVSHSTDNTDEWLVDDYQTGSMYHSPRTSGLMVEMAKGRLWYDKDDFMTAHGHEEGFVEPADESVNEATPRKKTPKPKSMFKPASPDILANREEAARQEAAARAKARAEQWAGMPDTDLPWEEQARRDLSIELDVDIEIDDSHRGDSVYMSAVHGKGNNGESEWVVYENQDEAASAAIERVKNDLENDPQIFSASFLESHITIRGTDRHLIAQEESDNLVDQVYDDQQILEEAGVTYEYEELQTQIDDLDPEEDTYESQVEALEAKKDAMLDEARETVREQRYEEIHNQLEDPVRYFVHETGMYNLEDLMKASFIRIDTEAAARDAVSQDTPDHYLDTYDGNGVELPSGAVAYGTN